MMIFRSLQRSVSRIVDLAVSKRLIWLGNLKEQLFTGRYLIDLDDGITNVLQRDLSISIHVQSLKGMVQLISR